LRATLVCGAATNGGQRVRAARACASTQRKTYARAQRAARLPATASYASPLHCYFWTWLPFNRMDVSFNIACSTEGQPVAVRLQACSRAWLAFGDVGGGLGGMALRRSCALRSRLLVTGSGRLIYCWHFALRFAASWLAERQPTFADGVLHGIPWWHSNSTYSTQGHRPFWLDDALGARLAGWSAAFGGAFLAVWAGRGNSFVKTVTAGLLRGNVRPLLPVANGVAVLCAVLRGCVILLLKNGFDGVRVRCAELVARRRRVLPGRRRAWLLLAALPVCISRLLSPGRRYLPLSRFSLPLACGCCCSFTGTSLCV